MRTLAEINDGPCKISLMFWHQRYLIRFELGELEQTYKVDAAEVPHDHDLKRLLDDSFIDSVKKRFAEMGHDFSTTLHKNLLS